MAVLQCECQVPECGWFAPWISLSPDGRTVTWTDPRDDEDVFEGVLADESDEYESRAWPSDLAFDRERLRPLALVLHRPDGSRGGSTAWTDDGLTLSFQGPDQQDLLRLTSIEAVAADTAADMTDQLLAVPPERWVEHFGIDPG